MLREEKSIRFCLNRKEKCSKKNSHCFIGRLIFIENSKQMISLIRKVRGFNSKIDVYERTMNCRKENKYLYESNICIEKIIRFNNVLPLHRMPY